MTRAKFYLYRNLRTGGFSIKQNGIVCQRGNTVVMDDVEFRVSEAGRQRAIKDHQRNVHAYMVADNYERIGKYDVVLVDSGMIPVTYNPFKNNTFVNANTGEPILTAKRAIAKDGKVWIVPDER